MKPADEVGERGKRDYRRNAIGMLGSEHGPRSEGVRVKANRWKMQLDELLRPDADWSGGARAIVADPVRG